MSKNPVAKTPAIHWIGAGLSSGPGIIALARKWGHIYLWDLTLDRANSLKQSLGSEGDISIGKLNLDNEISQACFREKLEAGDIIISMLPASFHVKVAHIALTENCHMVTSSYLSDEMLALNEEACAKGLSLVNEVGLDPGIDHLLTHILVDNARQAGVLGKGNRIDFISYCGGIPVEKTPFTYKFSWTPLGVLTALKNKALMIKNGKKHAVSHAWNEVETLSIEGEEFEVYPNRNSLPYIQEYGLDGESNLQTFVRGTLRLSGWKEAWKDIFTIVQKAEMDDLKTLSDKLWRENAYAEGEKDRVVLYVALTATTETNEKWQAALFLDHTGSGWQSAMASCVSLTVAEAVNALMDKRLSPGVQPAPHSVTEAKLWLRGLQEQGLKFKSDNITL